MITLTDIISREPNDGDTVNIEDVTFTYNKSENHWTHDEYLEENRFDYNPYILYGTMTVFIKKTLMDEKDWWMKIV